MIRDFYVFLSDINMALVNFCFSLFGLCTQLSLPFFLTKSEKKKAMRAVWIFFVILSKNFQREQFDFLILGHFGQIQDFGVLRNPYY